MQTQDPPKNVIVASSRPLDPSFLSEAPELASVLVLLVLLLRFPAILHTYFTLTTLAKLLVKSSERLDASQKEHFLAGFGSI